MSSGKAEPCGAMKLNGEICRNYTKTNLCYIHRKLRSHMKQMITKSTHLPKVLVQIVAAYLIG